LEGWGALRVSNACRGLEGSIRTAREAIAQRIHTVGHDHRETAILYNSLAITLTSLAGWMKRSMRIARPQRSISDRFG